MDPCAHRLVLPELLDELPVDDPRAVRSRRDLRWINALMGNEAWMLRQLRRHASAAANGVVEWGAGDAAFTRKMRKCFPAIPLAAYDLQGAPDGTEGIVWYRGDLTKQQPPERFGVLVANLFLHHFNDTDLSWVLPWMSHCEVMIWNEPLRKNFAHGLGLLMHPLINDVTKHDMHISIDAGFRKGELPALFADEASHWKIEESEHWKGALRSVWVRR